MRKTLFFFHVPSLKTKIRTLSVQKIILLIYIQTNLHKMYISPSKMYRAYHRSTKLR